MINKGPEMRMPDDEGVSEDGIQRHYSRERRLAGASPEVRWLSKQYGAKRPGILGSLLATGPLRFMFFTLLLFMAAGALLSFLAGREDSGLLGGSLYKAAAFRFGDSVYITVTRTSRGESAYQGPLRLTAYLDGRPAASGNFAAGSVPKEEYRLTAPSPVAVRKLSVRIEAGGLSLDLTAPVR
jgi:hypothetical protein